MTLFSFPILPHDHRETTPPANDEHDDQQCDRNCCSSLNTKQRRNQKTDERQRADPYGEQQPLCVKPGRENLVGWVQFLTHPLLKQPLSSSASLAWVYRLRTRQVRLDQRRFSACTFGNCLNTFDSDGRRHGPMLPQCFAQCVSQNLL